MAKTIKEIKKARLVLEESILNLIKTFEEENDVRINYISTHRERGKSTKDGYHPCCCMPEESYQDQPLNDVEVELRFDI